jgi:tetratricopeptide (TPR) repeat protein
MSNSSSIKQADQNFIVVNRRLIILLIAAVLLVHFNSIFNGFVFDDHMQILKNQLIRDIKHIPEIFSSDVSGAYKQYDTSYYRPMMYLIYMFNYYFFGLSPWGYHLINVLFHVGVCILVFLIASKIFKKPSGSGLMYLLSPAFIAAILYATHPIHTEAVAWVAAVPDLSFTFFYLLSLYLYSRTADSEKIFKRPAYILSLLSFFIATLCKEPAVTLPVVLILYDYTLNKTRTTKLINNLPKYIPYFIIAAFYLVLRYDVLGGFTPSVNHKLTTYQYVINVFPLFSGYVEKLLVPINLRALYVFHPISSLFEVEAIPSLVICLLFLIAAIIAFKKNRVVFFSLMLFAVPILPALYIPGLGKSAFGERQLYLPSFGFVLLAGSFLSWAAVKVSKPTFLMPLIIGMIVLVYSVGTINRYPVWKSDYSLWTDVVDKAPENATAHGYLGYALYSRGRIDDAIVQYRTSLKLNPKLFYSHMNLGVAYQAKKLRYQAVQQYLEALELNPSSINAHINIAQVIAKMGFRDKAIEQYQFALKLDPSSAKATHGLGTVFGNAGLYDKAIEYFEMALQLDPTNQIYKSDLEKAYNLKETADSEAKQSSIGG